MPDDRSDTEWRILVVRSGGITGMQREWRVSSNDPDAAAHVDWAALVDSCPWPEDDAADTAGDSGRPDGYVWKFEALQLGGTRRETLRECRAIQNDPLDPPWRSLVNGVKSARRP
jgi:hypothetical protein